MSTAREADAKPRTSTQMMRGESFALLNHIGGGVGRPHAHKEVDMIGLSRQFQNFPALLSTLLLDEGLAVFGDTPPSTALRRLGHQTRW